MLLKKSERYACGDFTGQRQWTITLRAVSRQASGERPRRRHPGHESRAGTSGRARESQPGGFHFGSRSLRLATMPESVCRGRVRKSSIMAVWCTQEMVQNGAQPFGLAASRTRSSSVYFASGIPGAAALVGNNSAPDHPRRYKGSGHPRGSAIDSAKRPQCYVKHFESGEGKHSRAQLKCAFVDSRLLLSKKRAAGRRLGRGNPLDKS